MNIQIASDLHLNLLEPLFPGYRIIEPADADVLVIAGDIHRRTEALATFRDWPVPVVYVHGNHEPYREQYFSLIDGLRDAARGGNVHYLEQDECILDGVRFLGCCLWTDYLLDPPNQIAAMAEAERLLYDHRLIQTPQGGFSAADALRLHRESRAWLEDKLNERYAGLTVVVTHHAPHPNSVHPRFAGSLLNAAFVSDLTPLIGKADLWIHGHVHDSFDYRVDGTRVVANPRGYALNRRAAASVAELEWENKFFDPRLVVTL
ncbi:MAG TPA: metallophosphoesterase [Burkholderiaceae bacterium]|jgi:predicted phosphodiesterase|nr:metallophosphoesterase [Burkholderiaceae bacterium]